MFAAAFGQQRLAHKLAQNGINPPTSPPPKHFRAVKFNREMFLSPNDLHVFWKQFLVNVSETLGFYLQRRRASLLGKSVWKIKQWSRCWSVFMMCLRAVTYTQAVLIDWREYKYAHALIDDLLVGTSRLIFDSNGPNCEIAPSMCSKFT